MVVKEDCLFWRHPLSLSFLLAFPASRLLEMRQRVWWLSSFLCVFPASSITGRSLRTVFVKGPGQLPERCGVPLQIESARLLVPAILDLLVLQCVQLFFQLVVGSGVFWGGVIFHVGPDTGKVAVQPFQGSRIPCCFPSFLLGRCF